MDKSLELKCHRMEKDYWWFVARRDIILRLIRKLDKNSKILEVGCSGGLLLQSLKDNGFKNICGIDISKEAINLCKTKRINNVFVMDGAKLKFPNKMFDIIITSDVLEHIKNEDSALSEWNRILKPGGKLIVIVPAFNFLWSNIDEINHHYRRYSKSRLLNALKKFKFNINRSSYWNFTLFLPISLIRISERLFLRNKLGKDELYGVSPLTNKLLIKLLKFENRLLDNWNFHSKICKTFGFTDMLNFPFGISVFAVATKPK